jgi:HrpA-like RNA helicase
MEYYEKYLKYKSKYLDLLKQKKDNKVNIYEPNEHPLAHFKKYNFIQSSGGLPKMYTTDIPARIEEFLKTGTKKIGIVYAPTGYGKTVAGCRIIAKVVNEIRSTTSRKIIGEILMPFRVSVKEMYNWLNKLGSEQGETLEYGYAMGQGDTNTSPLDDAVVQTVGYWRSRFLQNLDDKTEKIIMLDEAHSSHWETNFVLNMLMWKIRQGAPIKLLISSATLDISKISEIYDIEPELFAVSAELTNQDLHYNPNYFNPIQNLKNDKLYKLIITYIQSAYRNPLVDRHILVLMPGEREIKTLITMLNRNEELSSVFSILPLYGTVDEQTKDAALSNTEKRKIIVATNMVENAITIDDLSATVDSCIRKETYIDKYNIQELRKVIASQASIKQTAGRTGRQGKKGQAYFVISEGQFNQCLEFSLNEVEKGPIHEQLIVLFKNNLPYIEILRSIDRSIISRDIDYLIENGIIVLSKDTYILTDKGKIISDFNIGMNAAIFIVNCILFTKSNRVDNSYYYYVTLITTWINSDKSIFYEPTDKSSKHQQLLKGDSLETFLNVWDKYNESKDKRKWCFEYSIQIKVLKEIKDNCDYIFRTLKSPSYKVKKEYLKYVSKSYSDVKEMIINQLLSSFPNFKLINKSARGFHNYKKEPFELDSKILIADRPGQFILGLTFFHSNRTTFITNFINRNKDKYDYIFEELERLEKEQERLALEEERKEHERLIRQEEELAAKRLEDENLAKLKEQAEQLEAERLRKQKREDDFPALGVKPRISNVVSLKSELAEAFPDVTLEKEKSKQRAQEKEKSVKLKKQQNKGFLFYELDD